MNYKRLIPTLAIAITAFSLFIPNFSPAIAQEDNRQFVDLSPEIKAKFLARMRSNMARLDDIMSELARGNMEEAAKIAERRMGFAHGRIEKMAKKGASDAQINEMVARIRNMTKGDDYVSISKAMHKNRPGGGMGMGKGGGGLGRFMPQEMRIMGHEMHKSAYKLADTARAAKTPPTAGDYKNILAALNDITTSCRSCHDAFRVK